jgi:hypothetical protein
VKENLEAHVRRLWGGDGEPSRLESINLQSELVRTVSASSKLVGDQVDRLNKLSLPLVSLNAFETRSSPIAAAWRFLDQICSDYRRISPRFDLRQLEEFRYSNEGKLALRVAHVDNQSLGVLGVGEYLDSPNSVETLWRWTTDGQPDVEKLAMFTWAFGIVLGPIVQFALTSHPAPWPTWTPDFQSPAGYEWGNQFIAAGALRLRNARPRAVSGGARA